MFRLFGHRGAVGFRCARVKGAEIDTQLGVCLLLLFLVAVVVLPCHLLLHVVDLVRVTLVAVVFRCLVDLR